jgi:hypothetical protein
MNFGEILWWTFLVFLFFAYLMVLWAIVGDLMADNETSGWVKAIWVVFLIFIPLTALIYLIVRGKGMQQRKMDQLAAIQAAQAQYIKQVAGSDATKSAAEQIAHAKQLLDSGTITPEEFEQLKAKALS